MIAPHRLSFYGRIHFKLAGGLYFQASAIGVTRAKVYLLPYLLQKFGGKFMESHTIIGLVALALVIGFIILIRRHSKPEAGDNQTVQAVDKPDVKARMRKP